MKPKKLAFIYAAISITSLVAAIDDAIHYNTLWSIFYAIVSICAGVYSSHISAKGKKEEPAFVIPEPLLELAKTFSKNFKTLSAGTYRTYPGLYLIEYLNNTGSNSIAGVGKKSGRMIINRTLLLKSNYSPDMVYVLILWLFVEKQIGNPIISDKVVIEHYLTTGRSIDNLIDGFQIALSSNMTYKNNLRMDQLIKFTQEVKK